MGTTYTLDNYKSDKEKELAAKRDRQQQQAQVNFRKLMKYLPQQMDGASDGVMASAKIAASNALANNLAAAESDFTSGMNEVLNNYRVEKQAEQDRIYGEAKSMIENQNWNTTEELSNYLYGEDGKGGVTADLSDMQKQNIAQLYKTYANDSVKQAEKAAAAEAAKEVEFGTGKLLFDKNIGAKGWGEGDNIRLRDTIGFTYDAEIESEVVDENLLNKIKTSNVNDKTVFAYDGGYYIRIDDKVYRIRQRPSDFGKIDESVMGSFENALDVFYGR